MHPTMTDFLDSLRLAGRFETVRSYGSNLRFYLRWLVAKKLDPLRVTTDQIRLYQRVLAEDYRTKQGRPLGRGTQVCRLSTVKAYYGWLARRSLIVVDVALPIQLPRIPQRMVSTEYLDEQETTALLQTKAKTASSYPEGSNRWAEQVRDLAYLSLAVSTGRRRAGLRHVRVVNVDSTLNQIRWEREKGYPAHVLPVVPWAMDILQIYLTRARPILNWHQNNDWVFVGDLSPQIGRNTIVEILKRACAETIAGNPDLVALPTKNIHPHSLRVTFASMLFGGGARIRVVNEMMMHRLLSTTGRYTHFDQEDLRRVSATAHPRP